MHAFSNCPHRRATSASRSPHDFDPPQERLKPFRIGAAFGVGLLSLCLICGCSPDAAQQATTPVASSTPAVGAEQTTPPIDTPPAPSAPRWSGLLDTAEQHLERHELAEAETVLKQVAEVMADLDADAQLRLKSLQDQFEEQTRTRAEERRQAWLEEARQQLAAGKLDEAGTTLESLLAAAPTDEQREAAREIEAELQKRHQVRRKLRTAVEFLSSSERGRVKEAQNLLWDEPEAAFPLLVEALQSDNKVLVANALEMLRKMTQPERTLPAMIGVLRRENQAASWPDAIREIQKVQQPGGGAPLLALAMTAPAPAQATAAFTALEGVVDPPADTILTVLPKLYQNGAELPAALGAAYHAVVTHRQFDLAARRGLDTPLTPAQAEQLAGLPARLEALIASDQDGVAWAARRLAVATRQLAPQAVGDVKIVRFTAEAPDSPAAALLDGVWTSNDPKTMWRHPPKVPTTIVFDLGTERTITGVRVWNENETGVQRGWKDVEIYVSSSLSPNAPVATGIVPQAPGLNDAPDYGCTLPVPFARGRYVKLQFLSAWRDDSLAGLSEVQFLGY
jgi:hypothetical protein